MSLEAMRGKENSPAPGHRRRRTLGNITNLSLSSSWASESLGLGLLKGSASGKNSNSASEAAQLREEIASLKKVIEEKEVVIQDKEADIKAQAAEFVFQLRRHTQVNEELISYNSRLSRDGGMLRDQLKLLQHEHSQMTVANREVKTELQLKLAKSQELVQELSTALRLQQQNGSSQSCDQDSNRVPGNVHGKGRRRSTGRRHSIANLSGDEDWNRAAKQALGMMKVDGTTKQLASWSSAADPTGVYSSKEQQQKQIQSTRYRQQHQQDVEQWHTPNLYGDLLGLEPMLEDSREGGSPPETTSSGSQRSSDDRDDNCNLGAPKSMGNVITEAKGCSSIISSRNAEAEALLTGPPPPSSAPLQKPSAKRGQALSSASKVASSQRMPTATTSASSIPTLHFSRRAPAGSVSCSSSAANSSSSSSSSSVATTGNGRPTRKAVEKVASYLEPALNTKMRRPD